MDGQRRAKIRRGDADEADAFGERDAGKQGLAGTVDGLLQIRPFLQRQTPHDGFERREADLERDRARGKIVPAKALCDDVTVDRDLPIYRWAIGQVIFIGGFIADGFHLPGRDDGALVDAKGEGFQQRPLIAQKGGEFSGAASWMSAMVRNPAARSFSP